MGQFGWWKRFALLALNTPFTAAADNAACTCTGLDYTDGGSYLVDGSSNDDFSFTSVFRCKLPLRKKTIRNKLTDQPAACGKPDTVEPILLDPEGVGYLCTEINMGAEGQQQYSSWYAFF